MNALQIAQAMISQLNKRDMMCWGFHKPQCFDSKSFNNVPHYGGVMFKVKGMRHKGIVMIRLLPSDTYMVTIGKMVKGEFVEKTSLSDIYCDNLNLTIDNLVEGYYEQVSA